MTQQIRRATVDDAQDIAQIQVSSWRSTYANLLPAEVLANMDVTRRTEVWRNNINSPNQDHFVAVLDGRAVGFVCGGPARGTWEYDGELYALYLYDEARYSQRCVTLCERAVFAR
jgi:hypothetical protein